MWFLPSILPNCYYNFWNFYIQLIMQIKYYIFIIANKMIVIDMRNSKYT